MEKRKYTLIGRFYSRSSMDEAASRLRAAGFGVESIHELIHEHEADTMPFSSASGITETATTGLIVGCLVGAMGGIALILINRLAGEVVTSFKSAVIPLLLCSVVGSIGGVVFGSLVGAASHLRTNQHHRRMRPRARYSLSVDCSGDDDGTVAHSILDPVCFEVNKHQLAA